jgi:hypothetical protein
MRGRGAAQRTATAADVFDDHRAEQCLQLVRQWAAQRVECAAGRKRDHEPNRPRRIGLRARHGRQGGRCGGTGCQLQKSTARESHGVPSSDDGDHRRISIDFRNARPPWAPAPPMRITGLRHIPPAALPSDYLSRRGVRKGGRWNAAERGTKRHHRAMPFRPARLLHSRKQRRGSDGLPRRGAGPKFGVTSGALFG